MAVFRFLVIDEDGQRVGRFETADSNWRAGDTFSCAETEWRLVEVLPEVSTMVEYNAVWVAVPTVGGGHEAAVESSSDVGRDVPETNLGVPLRNL